MIQVQIHKYVAKQKYENIKSFINIIKNNSHFTDPIQNSISNKLEKIKSIIQNDGEKIETLKTDFEYLENKLSTYLT